MLQICKNIIIMINKKDSVLYFTIKCKDQPSPNKLAN
jgi:hypothetical protein